MAPSRSALPSPHRVPVRSLDDLATGGGDPDSVRLLLAGEHSRRLLLLRHLLDLAAARPWSLGDLPSAAAAWRDLETVERVSPVTLVEVLMHPQVGIWLSSTVRALRGGHLASPLWTEVGQVHALVLAAATRAGTTVATRVPVHSGHALLPTLGLARFATDAPWAAADAWTSGRHTVLTLGSERINVPDPATADGPSWWGLRRLASSADGHDLRVWLDDIDRYRNLADPVPPARLDAGEVGQWLAMLDEAWHLLRREWPDYAGALAIGFSSISPLPADRDSRITHSASTGDGFGAALISPPADGTSLAVALVHEFQHIKLGGLLHLVSLHDDETSDQLYAPWRDDPRPFGGLFQGVYAFLGIALFWQRHAGALSGRAAVLAQFEFAYARRQTREALHTLAGSPRLTAPGRRFVDGMRATVRALSSVRIPPGIERAAWAAAADHRAVWRLRNRSLPAPSLTGLVEAWRAGDPPPAPGALVIAATPADGRWRYPRIVLHRTRMAAPDRFAELAAEPDALPSKIPRSTPADLALVGGEYDLAHHGYLRQIERDPEDVSSWAGLGLALAAAGRPGWRSLLREPHVVHAVHARLRREHTPADPVELARWLATAGWGRCHSPREGFATR